MRSVIWKREFYINEHGDECYQDVGYCKYPDIKLYDCEMKPVSTFKDYCVRCKEECRYHNSNGYEERLINES